MTDKNHQHYEKSLKILSKIDDGILEKNTAKRVRLSRKLSPNYRKKKKWIAALSVAACFVLLFVGVFGIFLRANEKQVPIYQGMSISGTNPTVQKTAEAYDFERFDLLAHSMMLLDASGTPRGPAENGPSAGLGNHPTPPVPPHEQTTNLPESGTAEAPETGNESVPETGNESIPETGVESTPETDAETTTSHDFQAQSPHALYYAKPNQDIYITVHIENPDSFEILSFTLNGNKYSSYMFEEGSDLENLVLKVNVGDAEGIVSYTIDAIKYVDGNEIKDVRMEGDKTVEIGVQTEKQPTAAFSNETVGFHDLSFTVELADMLGLISYSGGSVKAVLYEGETQVDEQEVAILGKTDVSFNGLKSNTTYTYAIVAKYDALDSTGVNSYTLSSAECHTYTVVRFGEVETSQEGVAFGFLWDEAITDHPLVALYLTDAAGQKTELSVDALSASGLLSGKTYSLTVVYLNGEAQETISYEFVTKTKTAPTLSFTDVKKTQTSIGFDYLLTDPDAIGTVTKVELLHGEDEPVDLGILDAYTVADLLSNNKYTVKVTYTYNLNDGEGVHTETATQEIQTDAKTVPTLAFADTSSTQTNIDFTLTETDPDVIGEISTIRLLLGEAEKLTASDLSTRTFAELLSDNTYTVEITYTYDLNDGEGVHTETVTKEITTLAKTVPVLSIDDATSTKISVLFGLSETDPDAIGTVTKVELLHGEDTPVDLGILSAYSAYEVVDLLSNNKYTVKVTYTYDLNDGEGVHTETVTQEITTLAKTVPVLSIDDATSTKISLSFGLSENDPDAIGNVTKVELLHGEDTPVDLGILDAYTVADLLSNNKYIVKVTYAYDLNDGEGVHTETVTKEITTLAKTVPVLSIDDATSTKISLSFGLSENDPDAIGTVTKVELLHGEDAPVNLGVLSSYEVVDLLSNNKYTVKVTYTYDLNDGEGVHTETVTKEIITVAKTVPVLSIDDATSTKTSLSFGLSENDPDAIGNVTKVELLHGEDTPVDLGILDAYTVADLLSNNKYTVKVTYTYDLNDGEGVHTETVTQEITTVAKIAPTVSLNYTDRTQTSILFDYTVTDPDLLGTVTQIELLQGETLLQSTEDHTVRAFTGLESYVKYTVKVHFCYDLNDGKGIHRDSVAMSLYTAPVFAMNSTDCLSDIVVHGESIILDMRLENPSGLIPISVKMNGAVYAVRTGSSPTRVLLDVTIDDSYRGGDTEFKMEELIFQGDGETWSYVPTENCAVSIYINVDLEVFEAFWVDADNNPLDPFDWYVEGETAYVMISVNNAAGYQINSVTLQGYDFASDSVEILEVTADYIKLSLRLNENEIAYSTFVCDLSLTEITYENEHAGARSQTLDKKLPIRMVLLSDEIVPIYTADDLRNMDGSRYYKLMQDIDLSHETDLNFGDMYGVFDGNGHTISGYTVVQNFADTEVKLGLFASCSGVIKNLELRDFLVSTSGGAVDFGGFATRALFAQFENVSISGSVSLENLSGKERAIGGLVGYGYDDWISCRASCLSFIDCSNSVALSASHGEKTSYYDSESDRLCYVGGLLGAFYADNDCSMIVASGCTNSGVISVIGGSAGGLIGYWQDTTDYNGWNDWSVSTIVDIKNCSNTANVSVQDGYVAYAGGLVGLISSYDGFSSENVNVEVTITGCSNSGDISGEELGYYHSGAGALIGCCRAQEPPVWSDCTNTGKITSDYKQGGDLFGILYVVDY